MNTPLQRILMSHDKARTIAYLKAHPEDVDEAIRLALGDQKPYCWRAAWLLCHCLQHNDPRIRPRIDSIIGCLPDKEDGHQRELIKILLLMDLDERQEGVVFDLCMDLWEKIQKAPSVRHTAFKMIARTAEKYPDLKKEIAFITQNHYLESLSPGIRRAVEKMVSDVHRA